MDALHSELGNQQAAVEGAALAAQQRHNGLQSGLKALQDGAAVSHQLRCCVHVGLTAEGFQPKVLSRQCAWRLLTGWAFAVLVARHNC